MDKYKECGKLKFNKRHRYKLTSIEKRSVLWRNYKGDICLNCGFNKKQKEVAIPPKTKVMGILAKKL